MAEFFAGYLPYPIAHLVTALIKAALRWMRVPGRAAGFMREQLLSGRCEAAPERNTGHRPPRACSIDVQPWYGGSGGSTYWFHKMSPYLGKDQAGGGGTQ